MADILPSDTVFEETIKGVQTKVLQHPVCKYYCGYVFLPEGHRFYGKGYDEINDICIYEKGKDYLNYWVTYSDFTNDDYWCIGFDIAPRFQEEEPDKEKSLKNAIKELTALALWL